MHFDFTPSISSGDNVSDRGGKIVGIGEQGPNDQGQIVIRMNRGEALVGRMDLGEPAFGAGGREVDVSSEALAEIPHLDLYACKQARTLGKKKSRADREEVRLW